MAPRGRSRVGNTRMDAAIDALTPMGFSSPQIRGKVKKLLKVYGGPEGWAFLEDASYKLLIESLLEDQESEKPEDSKLLEYRASVTAEELLFEEGQQQQLETGNQGVEAETSEPVPSDLPGRTSCSEQDSVHSNPETVLEPVALPSPGTQNSGMLEDQTEIDMEDIQRQIALILLETQDTPPGFEHLARQQIDPAPRQRRRKPCLGWIGPKDDDDFVLLEPMPVEGQEERRRTRGKLKSRWDEKPVDAE